VILGLERPVLVLDARSASLLWPAVQAFVAEHHRLGALAKLRILESTLADWQVMVGLLEDRGFTDAPTGRNRVSTGGNLASISGGPPKLHTADEAAEMLGVTPQWVRKLCARGDLPASRHGGRWLIPSSSIESMRTP
jgi:excisionase family DNA binding protein